MSEAGIHASSVVEHGDITLFMTGSLENDGSGTLRFSERERVEGWLCWGWGRNVCVCVCVVIFLRVHEDLNSFVLG